MKTAMQFLKNEIESKIIPSSKENGELSDYQYGHNIAYSVVLTLAEYLIEKEKEQIIEAHFEGWSDAYDYLSEFNNDKARQAEEYYKETYEIE